MGTLVSCYLWSCHGMGWGNEEGAGTERGSVVELGPCFGVCLWHLQVDTLKAV